MKLGLKIHQWKYSLAQYIQFWFIGFIFINFISYVWWTNDIKDAMWAIFLSTLMGWVSE